MVMCNDNTDLYIYAESKDITIDNNAKITETKSFAVEVNDRQFIIINEKEMSDTAEERVRLAHELGHCETGSFYNIGADYIQRLKCEARATRWAVKALIDKEEFARLIDCGWNKWEIADHFRVNIEFLDEAYRLYFEVGMAG